MRRMARRNDANRAQLLVVSTLVSLVVLVAVAADAALVLAALYVPWLQALLDTEPLGAADLALVLAVSLAGALSVAAEHVLARRAGTKVT